MAEKTNIMNEGLIKDAYEAVIKEIQSIITICYILAVAVGMLFNYQKYSKFGINIFDYADVFDFLITPFSDLKILLFVVVSLAIPYIIMKIDIFWRRKAPKTYSMFSFGLDKKSWYNSYRYSSFAILFVFYLYVSASIYASFSKQLTLDQTETTIRFSDNEIQKGKMIGKTNDVVFFLVGKKVKAIPIISLVKEIEIVQ